METYHYATVPAETLEDLPGVSTRWAIGKNVGAPNFVLRVIEVEAGASTPYHQHPWEHEAFVLEGEAAVRDTEGETLVGPGTCIYIEPNEIHQFINKGDDRLRFICVIPYPPEDYSM